MKDEADRCGQCNSMFFGKRLVMTDFGIRCLECYGRLMPFRRDDGGRADAGYSGETRDCVVRAIAIATQRPYQHVYDEINEIAKTERSGKRCGSIKTNRSSARMGVKKATIRRYMKGLGWSWTPTMQIGSGCKVHLKPGELPDGRLVVNVSKHSVALIDGVMHDMHDPSRGGTRCVYGYYSDKTNI